MIDDREIFVVCAVCIQHQILPKYVFSLDFFEECIKEEQYEAEKLDILRDAVRAKATYTKTKDDLGSPREATSPSPPPLTPVHENGNGEVPNGTATNGSATNGAAQ